MPEAPNSKTTRELIRELFEMVIAELRSYPERVYEVLDGEKVAEQIARFYERLLKSGIPRGEAASLTRLYAEKLLESLNPLPILEHGRREADNQASRIALLAAVSHMMRQRGEREEAHDE